VLLVSAVLGPGPACDAPHPASWAVFWHFVIALWANRSGDLCLHPADKTNALPGTLCLATQARSPRGATRVQAGDPDVNELLVFADWRELRGNSSLISSLVHTYQLEQQIFR
jgi:hypothetical protein